MCFVLCTSQPHTEVYVALMTNWPSKLVLPSDGSNIDWFSHTTMGQLSVPDIIRENTVLLNA